MLIHRIIVKLPQIEEYLRNREYSKVEVRPARLKNLRDIELHCYYKVEPSIVRTIVGSLTLESNNEILPMDIRSKLGGLRTNFNSNNLWISLSDFKEMMDITDEYNISLSIPKKYRKLYSELTKK